VGLEWVWLRQMSPPASENHFNHWPVWWLGQCRLGLAIVPLCRDTGAPLRRTQAPPGPFEIFRRVRYGEKFYYRCGLLPTPLVVMKSSE